MQFVAGAYAVIFDDEGRVLLSHRRDCDFWNLPGGAIESGETPWQAAVREVREEVCLEVEVERLAGLYSWTALDEVIYSFVCRVTGGVLGNSDESDDARYFPLDALPKNTFLEHINRIRDATLGQHQAILRIPKGPTGRDQAAAQRTQDGGAGANE